MLGAADPGCGHQVAGGKGPLLALPCPGGLLAACASPAESLQRGGPTRWARCCWELRHHKKTVVLALVSHNHQDQPLPAAMGCGLDYAMIVTYVRRVCLSTGCHQQKKS